jgi:hypothetical protein
VCTVEWVGTLLTERWQQGNKEEEMEESWTEEKEGAKREGEEEEY